MNDGQMGVVLVRLAVWAVCGTIVGWVAAKSNRNVWAWGIIGGLVLLPALIILAYLPDLCPKCHKPVKKHDARPTLCGNCGCTIEPKYKMRHGPINDKDLAQMKELFSSKSTSELMAIYSKQDVDEYRPEAIEAMRLILVERGEINQRTTPPTVPSPAPSAGGVR